MISEKSEMMQTRLGSSAQEIQMHIDDILLNPSKYEELRAFTQKHGYFLQTGTQNVVDQVVWIGAYEQAIEEGGSEKDAVRAADAAVRQTQGSMNPEDVSRLETGAPFFRLFTMFYSYFNMLANLYGTEFVKVQRDLGLKKGMGRLLYVYVFGFAIPAFLSELIVKAMAGGIDEDDDDEYLDDLMSMFFGSQYRTATALVPAVGPLVNAAVNRFNDKQYDDRISTSPAISMLESTTSAPYSVYKAVEGEGSKKRAIRDTLTAVGMLSGVPVAPLGKPLGYLADVSEGKAEPTGPVDFARGLVTGKAGGPNR